MHLTCIRSIILTIKFKSNDKGARMNIETLNLTTTNGAATAYVARPDTEVSAGVLLIQEYWGINDHIRDLAGRFADEGYLCVAPDLYRGRLAKDPKEAAAMMDALAIEDGMETIRKAMDAAKQTYGVKQFGIIGFCMGGTFALRAACDLAELSAAAAFYGDIPSEPVLAKLKVPTLFVVGNRDTWITPEKADEVRDAASKYDLPIEVLSYEADHAFFNDTRPAVYDAEASKDAWERVLELFDRNITP